MLSRRFASEVVAGRATAPKLDWSFAARVLKDVFREERFIAWYAPVIIDNPDPSAYLQVYASNELVDHLRRSG